MKGAKCILLLALFTIFGSFFVVSSDVNALQHQYEGIPLTSPAYNISYNSDTGSYYVDWSNGSSSSQSVNIPFEIDFDGDSYYEDLSDLSLKYSASYLPSLTYGSNSCQYTAFQHIFDFSRSSDPNSLHVGSVLPSFYSGFSSLSGTSNCYTHNSIPFDRSTLPGGIMQCNELNGAVCGGFWNTNEYISSQILPNWTSHSDLILSSTATSSEGIVYDHTFSFSDLFNKSIKKFSFLQLPLWDNNDSHYFLNSDNLYYGRQIEFSGSFRFNSTVTWHDSSGGVSGSYWRVHLLGLTKNNVSYDSTIDCSVRTTTVLEDQYINFDCDGNLEDDFLVLFPYLEISGNGSYLFTTDDDWSIGYTYFTTDGDSTPGDAFNSNHWGGSPTKFGDAANDLHDDDISWFDSLTRLFNFNFLNPFVPLFSLFSNQDSCAQIPTLAGMLHSESSTVCPFFDSNVRSILTPVLGISGMMLVFGFAVKWLGAQSGNFFEDSGGISAPTSVPTGSSGVKRLGWRRK